MYSCKIIQDDKKDFEEYYDEDAAEDMSNTADSTGEEHKTVRKRRAKKVD